MNLVPVSGWALLSSLAVPYLTCAVRALTSDQVTDRVAVAPSGRALGVLAGSAAVLHAYLHRTMLLPVEGLWGGGLYLLTVSARLWRVLPKPRDPIADHDLENFALPLHLAVAVVGMAAASTLLTPLTGQL